MEKQSFFKRFRKTIITLAIFVILFFTLAFYVGFQHIPHHLSDLGNGIASLFKPANAMSNTTDPTNNMITDVVADAPDFPLDTLMWAEAIQRGDEVDAGVKAELEKIRKTGFPNLRISEEKPSDSEIHDAIIYRFGTQVEKMLKDYDATLKGGKAYYSPVQKSEKNGQEIARITISVSAFNSKGDNLLNIQEPMMPVYDFVKFEDDPKTWYVTDLSQTIPFDYTLNARN